MSKKTVIDYTKFSPEGPPSEPEASNRWWEQKGEALANSVSAVVEVLQQNQTPRDEQNVLAARLYGNLSLLGVNRLSQSRIAALASPGKGKDRLTYNVIQSAVDTVTSKMAKNKPKPLFLTSGGNYKIQRRAQKLQRFTDGVFYEQKAYVKGVTTFRHGAVFGTGATHVFPRFGRVCFETVLPGELEVDEVEAFDGDPRQLHRVKNLDRALVAARFPKAKKLIMSAKSPEVASGFSNIADVIKVRESWHLPSGPDSNDGFHCLTLDNGTIDGEIWTKTKFPFSFFHWNKRLLGFWGQSLVEQLQGIQLEINKLLWVAQRSFHLAGSFKIFLENGSRIVKEYINNEIGAIVTYTGTQPSYVVPNVLPAEFLTHLWNLKNAAFEVAGVSMLSAASKKPDGLNSGKALREFNDIESDRFMTVGQAYEQYYCDLAELAVDTAKEIFEETGKYQVQVPGKRSIEVLDWKDVSLERDQYILKIFPVSSLPTDPAGRLQTIQEYAQAGFMKPRTARRLLDSPDLEAEEDLANAPEEYLHKILEAIVEDGEYTPPEPYDDLQLAQELVLEYYAKGKASGLEEDKLEMLRKFDTQVKTLVAKATQPPPAPAGALPPGGAGSPQAVPEPTPQSNLIPNVPGGNQ